MMSRDFFDRDEVMEQSRIPSPEKIIATAIIQRWIPKITKRMSNATENIDMGGIVEKEERVQRWGWGRQRKRMVRVVRWGTNGVRRPWKDTVQSTGLITNIYFRKRRYYTNKSRRSIKVNNLFSHSFSTLLCSPYKQERGLVIADCQHCHNSNQFTRPATCSPSKHSLSKNQYLQN